ncbi:MAG: fumarate hydratase [Candidatus Lokiarchaeota archaeon]|nr:fumarate hydratase [Candidatus Harpocratesius repetitus]
MEISFKIHLAKIIENAIYQLILKSSTSVPDNVMQKIQECQDQIQPESVAAIQLKLMKENLEYGKMNRIPICQDTGHLNFFIQLGDSFPIISDFKKQIEKSIEKLTNEAIIRPNTVDPISNKNPQNNLGLNYPPIYIEIIQKSEDLIITLLNKGGGSENMSKLYMLSASSGKELIIPTVIETIKQAGSKPCPPIIVGVGIGGDAVKSMFLAKKSLLRPISSRNLDSDLADLENKLLHEINKLDIGIMGLGGSCTCLDVHVERSMRHPATYPLGIVIDCYSHRIRSCKITKNGKVLFGTLNSEYKFQPEKKNAGLGEINENI